MAYKANEKKLQEYLKRLKKEKREVKPLEVEENILKKVKKDGTTSQPTNNK